MLSMQFEGPCVIFTYPVFEEGFRLPTAFPTVDARGAATNMLLKY